MCLSGKNVVPLGRASVLRLAQRHCWTGETLEVYWVSETAKTSSPKNRQPVSVHTGTDYCCCRGEALGGAQIPQ